MSDSAGGAGGYNINPSIADAYSNTPTQTVNAGTTIVFSSPGTDASQSSNQTVTPSTTAKADATAAGGTAASSDSAPVSNGGPGLSGSAGFSILDYVLIGIAAVVAIFIAKKFF